MEWLLLPILPDKLTMWQFFTLLSDFPALGQAGCVVFAVIFHSRLPVFAFSQLTRVLPHLLSHFVCFFTSLLSDLDDIFPLICFQISIMSSFVFKFSSRSYLLVSLLSDLYRVIGLSYPRRTICENPVHSTAGESHCLLRFLQFLHLARGKM